MIFALSFIFFALSSGKIFTVNKEVLLVALYSQSYCESVSLKGWNYNSKDVPDLLYHMKSIGVSSAWIVNPEMDLLLDGIEYVTVNRAKDGLVRVAVNLGSDKMMPVVCFTNEEFERVGSIETLPLLDKEEKGFSICKCLN